MAALRQEVRLHPGSKLLQAVHPWAAPEAALLC